ncbi:tetracycline resistance protein, class D [Malaya genurostris]|uniref:tetracycline resistance protein, class D n=1 Tax=Malaya genurostris TaxID=325434 RepID=UPI0026F3A043|nr:tetracycline resistance protein, class D [Malaya genurostris]XP_058463175.1 tetracycline resistance protein, class D [Malaya genurostris]XP_058463176.1 tetracycline resistance protein, class D [Malaya genurostris]XP_058463177.1 tetracycline resistance protein, class D [Malaya genurostris]
MDDNDQNVQPEGSTSLMDTTRNKYEQKYRFFILEPAILLLFYAWNVSAAVFTNQIVYQTCTVTLAINQSECVLLGTENETESTQELEKTVQPYTTNILMAKSLIESIIPALCSMFIGPWSDKYGRKPVLLSTFIGSFFSYSLLGLVCFLSGKYPIDPWYYVLTFIPAALSGGNCALITGVFCYITDVTSEENRAIKMGVLEASIFGGLLFGTLSSSYILHWTNSTTVFAIAAVAILIGIVYITFYIEESVQPNELATSSCKLREIFRFELVADLFHTCFKRRPNFDRVIIWLVISALGASIFAMEGNGTVHFLYYRERFGWTVKEFSFFDATIIVFMIVGNIVGVYGIKKWFGLSESVLAAIGFCCYAIDSGIKGVAFKPWHLYLAIVISMMKGNAGPMGRAVISNTAPPNDIGKIFSLTTSIESLTPLLSAPFYTYVYKKTLPWFPGAFFLISSAVYFCCVFLMIFVRIFEGMHQSITYSVVS